MNKSLVKLNEEIYMTISDSGDIKLLQGTFTEENINYIVGAKNEIESKENDIKHYEELLNFIKFKSKVSKFMMYYRILIPFFLMILAFASSLSSTTLLIKLLLNWLELSIVGEFFSRITVFVASIFLDNSNFGKDFETDFKRAFFLSTNKKRKKEVQEYVQKIQNSKKEIEELEDSIRFLKNLTKCKEVEYRVNEKVTIAPIDRSLEETTIKISTLSRKKNK